MNVLITGAQFGNKGAESMLYTTVDEVMKRWPDSNVYFGTYNDEIYNESLYTFHKFYFSHRGIQIALGGPKAIFVYFKEFIKDFIKICLRRTNNLGHLFFVKKHIEDIDLIIDVSGFNLGVNWTKGTHSLYIDKIRLAEKHNIPIYLMPQSFGPFDYKDSSMNPIKTELGITLKYPRLIFAREKEGYDELIEEFTLNNVLLSTDLVLQNNYVNWKNVYVQTPKLDIPKIEHEKVVGIIPNSQCFKFGDKSNIINLYQSIVNKLLSDGYHVVVFRHSREDLPICNEIKSLFSDESKVFLEEKEFSCFEYSEYVKQFNFVICSRYHGLVHAYKNNVPCVALGWAVKYKELTECLGQGMYSFDITQNLGDSGRILDALTNMEKDLDKEKRIIKDRLEEIQLNNCFDLVEKDFNSLKSSN